MFKGLSPDDDDCSRPKQKKKWKEFKARADLRLIYLFEVDGWIKGPQCEKWIRQFNDRTKHHMEPGTYRVLQEDNWGIPVSTEVTKFMKDTRIYLVNTTGNMTDLLTVIDDGLGQFMKDRIALKYSRHFEKNEENTGRWTTKGGFTEMDIRVFFSKWIAEAWEELKDAPEMILNTFNHCGFANDMYGRENHKVHLRHVFWYQVPPRSDEGKKFQPLTREEIQEGEERIRKFRSLPKKERKDIMNKKRKNTEDHSRNKKKI